MAVALASAYAAFWVLIIRQPAVLKGPIALQAGYAAVGWTGVFSLITALAYGISRYFGATVSFLKLWKATLPILAVLHLATALIGIKGAFFAIPFLNAWSMARVTRLSYLRSLGVWILTFLICMAVYVAIPAISGVLYCASKAVQAKK